MGFKKYEVLVRKNSTIKIDDVMVMFKNAINDKQSKDDTLLWAASIFDLRSLKEYMIFSDKSAETFNINDTYETNSKEVIPGVMKLGQKIMDVNKTIQNKITENKDLIDNIVSENGNIKLIKTKVDDHDKQLNQMKKSVEDLNKLKDTFGSTKDLVESEIKKLENNIGVKIEDLNKLFEVLKEQSDENKKENDNTNNTLKETIQKISDLDKDKLNEIESELKVIKDVQANMKNFEDRLNKLSESISASNEYSEEELNEILDKLANNEELTPEEESKLTGILGSTQGYIL